MHAPPTVRRLQRDDRALIQRVVDLAAEAGSTPVDWTTHTINAAGRALYDQMTQHQGFIVYNREI